MYCPKCGKENPEDARFCMHCGADLGEMKVEISPKIEVSPKISVSAKAEGGVALKWKQKPLRYAEVWIDYFGKSENCEKKKLPVFEKFIRGSGCEDYEGYYDSERFFCPQCGNYGSLVEEESAPEYFKEGGVLVHQYYELYKCQACEKLSLLLSLISKPHPVTPHKYVYLDFKDIGKVPIYEPSIHVCPKCGADDPKIVYSDLYRRKVKWMADNGVIYQYMRYKLYKCSACKFQSLHMQQVDESCEDGTTHEDYYILHPLCEVCENHKAEYTCSSCGKQICENCVVKKGLLSKKYLCPNCK